MTFTANNFNAFSHISGFTAWHYKSITDSLETICADDYFDQIKYGVWNDDVNTAQAFNVGDMIVIDAADGTCIVKVTQIEDTVRVAPLYRRALTWNGLVLTSQ